MPTKADEATNVATQEEKRKNNRSRGGRRGGNNRRRSGNRTNATQGESKDGSDTASSSASTSQEG